MTERDDPVQPIKDPPAPGQSSEPQELPGAEPALDRDDDDPDDGPLGERDSGEQLIDRSVPPFENETGELHKFDPGPISGFQHDLEHMEPRTDDAISFHPTTADANDPSSQGPTNSA